MTQLHADAPLQVDELWSISPSSLQGRDADDGSDLAELRGVRLILRHRQTGLSVVGTMVIGFGSRGEMQEIKTELRARLKRELSEAVTRRRRLPYR
jgi:hypothetical protein